MPHETGTVPRPEDSVFTPRPEAQEMIKRLRLVRALRGGTEAMRDAREQFLPIFGKETKEQYEKRLKRTFLTPAYADALDDHASFVFSEPIRFLDDVPEEVLEFGRNVDGQGGSLNAWAPDVFKAGEDDGLVHVLANRAQDAEVDGDRTRPYLQVIRADELIWWAGHFGANGWELEEIRFREDVLVRDGISGFAKMERVRTIRPGAWELHEREGEGSEERQVEQGVFGLDHIPLSTFYTAKEEPMVARPFNLALAWKNLEHWQLSSEVGNLRVHTLIPFRKFLGISDDTFKQIGEGIGSDLAVHSTAKANDTDIGWVPADVESLKAGRQELERIEAAMDRLAKAPTVSRRSGNVTATEKAIDSAAAHTDIQHSAIKFEDFLNSALTDLAAWWQLEDKMPEGGSVEVNKDFQVTVDSSDVGDVFTALDKGIIDDEATFFELQRRDTLSDKHDKDEVLARARVNRLDSSLGAGAFGRDRMRQMLERVANGEGLEDVLDDVTRQPLRLIQS